MEQLTPEQVDQMPAGAELDALAAELVMGWSNMPELYCLRLHWSPSKEIATAFELHRDGWSWRFSETVLRVIASVHNTHIEVYEDTGHISEACVYWSEIGGTHGDPAAYALARTRCAVKAAMREGEE